MESDRKAVAAAEAAIQQAEAALKTVRINLGYTAIIAPIAGRIGRSGVTEGALVTAHQPIALAIIQQLDPMYVDVPQSTAELLRLRNRLKDGRLRQRRGNPRTRSVSSWKTTPNTPGRGSFSSETSLSIRRPDRSSCGSSFPIRRACCCRACSSGRWLKKGSIPSALLIPQQAVSRDPKGNPVTLIVDAAGQGPAADAHHRPRHRECLARRSGDLPPAIG